MEYQNLKYLVVGAGAIGGCMGAFLADAGKDVTFIARNKTLQAINENGLELHTPHATYSVPVKAVTEDEYDGHPDVVLVCVKAYALDEIVPFLDRVCSRDTIVIPLLNSLDMGSILKAKMHTEVQMTSGVAYVAVVQLAPGVVKQKLPFYRVVFGPLDGMLTKRLWKVRQDMLDAGMASELIKDPVQGALRKFVRVSTISAICAYYNQTMGVIRDDPEAHEMYMDLCNEIIEVAKKRGTPFEDDALEDALTIAMTGPKEYKTSLKYDMDAGRPMELQTMFFDVYEMGRKLGLEMPAYGKVCRKFGYKD